MDWLPAGGEGPATVRGMAVDPRVPQEAPGRYFADPQFPYECSRLALVFLMTGVRASYGRLELCLVDCANFINMSEFTVLLVAENPYDFEFNWFARLVAGRSRHLWWVRKLIVTSRVFLFMARGT